MNRKKSGMYQCEHSDDNSNRSVNREILHERKRQMRATDESDIRPHGGFTTTRQESKQATVGAFKVRCCYCYQVGRCRCITDTLNRIFIEYGILGLAHKPAAT